MSTKIIDLEDRIITDTGDVVFKMEYVLKQIIEEHKMFPFKAIADRDIHDFNFRSGDTVMDIPQWTDDGKLNGPPDETFDWIIPQKYQDLDLVEYSTQKLQELNLVSDNYIDRLSYELEEMESRNMFPFIRCILYVIDVFRENGVVWGVGRGSSCASLVLFILGINRVDPVKYDIPVEEFLK